MSIEEDYEQHDVENVGFVPYDKHHKGEPKREEYSQKSFNRVETTDKPKGYRARDRSIEEGDTLVVIPSTKSVKNEETGKWDKKPNGHIRISGRKMAGQKEAWGVAIEDWKPEDSPQPNGYRGKMFCKTDIYIKKDQYAKVAEIFGELAAWAQR